VLDRLTGSYPNVTAGRIPQREADSLFLASKIRLGLDYLRYLEPIYGAASGLRPRAAVRTPTGIVRLSRSRLLGRPSIRRILARFLDSADRAVPPSPAIEAYLDAQHPDLIVITPLIGLVASVSGRLAAQRPGAGDSDRGVCLELGSPLEQGSHSRLS
jgi:hypothetical protein